LQLEERSMRFLLLMFATAAVGLACEKDPALSKSTNNLAPAPDTTAPDTTALPAIAPPSTASTAVDPRIAAPPAVVAVETPVKPAVAQQVVKPASTADEGNGEPMDDVDDDEAVPATDKSGVDEPVDEDSDGVGIDIKQ
jgi:hypothetical protein